MDKAGVLRAGKWYGNLRGNFIFLCGFRGVEEFPKYQDFLVLSKRVRTLEPD